MASLILYGSDVTDATLTSACDMATTTGGTETNKTTTVAATSNTWVEILSLGTASATSFTAIQSPSGKGWTYTPGAGTFATGNWSGSIRLSATTIATSVVLRFYKYSSGTYTSIGSITITAVDGTLSTKSFPATSMSSVTFGASDILYTDLWWQDNSSNVGGDNPTIYESTSSSVGVANDMQITTSSFTASGGAVHLRISDGLGGVFS